VISVICLLFANVVVAMGRTRILLAVQGAALVALVPAMKLGITHAGIVGVGLAHIAVIAVVTLPVYLVAVRRSAGAAPALLGRAVTPPVVAALLAAGAALLASRASDVALVQLLAGGLAGGAVYGLLMVRELLGVVGLSGRGGALARVVDATEWSRRWLTRGGVAA